MCIPEEARGVKLNWVGQYHQADGYGRFNSRLVAALRSAGVEFGDADLTITCHPPFLLEPVQGKHWLFSMTEGSRIPPDWVEKIEQCNIERVIVPCEHNALAFRESGVTVPISIVPGGIDPDEFSVKKLEKSSYRPYVFLTFADRGNRKGWEEVWEAFYLAFGGKTRGEKDVRLLIKTRAGSPTPVEYMCNAKDSDGRISYRMADEEDMLSFYAQADCLVLPSRSEGWGLIHREAAAVGLPVITQKYSGLDDGSTEQWALTLPPGKMKPIPTEAAFCLGEWMVANVYALSEMMRWAFDFPESAHLFGEKAAIWLKEHQTWRHSALALIDLVKTYG